MRSQSLLLVFSLVAATSCSAQLHTNVDTDRDGLSDATEDALLQRFAPQFMISSSDCSAQPAQFIPGVAMPTVLADDGSIYGQASPHRSAAGKPAEMELHFYHLWRTDCGRMGHPLDAEHVAVLLQNTAGPADIGGWKATFWYAAAHEDTVCDDSQIARASTLHAETRGATVWVSAGKHGSFLGEELCRTGCGGDRCVNSRALSSPPVINLGEWNTPMNGAVWITSTRWPLRDKLTRSDFPASRIALLNARKLDVAWANPSKRPVQAAIYGGNSGIDGAATGANATGNALAIGGESTDAALSQSAEKTGGSLGHATADTGHAIGKAARGTGHALRKTLHGMRKAVGGEPQSQPAK